MSIANRLRSDDWCLGLPAQHDSFGTGAIDLIDYEREIVVLRNPKTGVRSSRLPWREVRWAS